MAAPSLESFHRRRSNRLAKEARLTRREASHSIVEEGSKRKKRRSRGGIEGTAFLRPLFIASDDALRVALSSPISHRGIKRPQGTSQVSLQSPQHVSERLCDSGRAVKAESGGIDNESSPHSTFYQARRPLRACLLVGLKEIRLSSGPPVIIDGPDPRAPSATASPLPNMLHVASTFHLPDEVGRHGKCTP
jgi:hypothetical protein